MFSFIILLFIFLFYFFFFNDPATTEIYTLSLHDALPIYDRYQWLAVEVSSFQLHDSPHFAPEIGIVTNLAPDHLDRYPTVEAYYADKQLLFRNARAGDVWVLNGDEPPVLDLAGQAPGRRVLFALRRRADG